MIGWKFRRWDPTEDRIAGFDELMEIFRQLLLHTAGNVSEALNWLSEMDRTYQFTSDDYTLSDFLNDLIQKGYLKPGKGEGIPNLLLTSRMEIHLRKSALDEIFDDLSKSGRGDHDTKYTGKGDEETSELRPYEFGDSPDRIDLPESLKNAMRQRGIQELDLRQEDLEVRETYYKTQTSSVLMIDISHSMILYGEDRITPARKVAMALSELITTRYPKDTLDIIVFGDDAWRVALKDLPYLQVGPYHTNTVAGLELALDILRKRKNPNKQILMITDGKPTCIKQGKNYYKNPFGLDRKILNRTLSLAHKCKKIDIPITTFMIATDPWLVDFVDKFTKANAGKAYYSSIDKLGEFVFKNYKK